jgi:hypothetical protein
MVKRESQGAGGAAGIPINWGPGQARAEGVPAYLDAGVQGNPVDTKYGFKGGQPLV